MANDDSDRRANARRRTLPAGGWAVVLVALALAGVGLWQRSWSGGPLERWATTAPATRQSGMAEPTLRDATGMDLALLAEGERDPARLPEVISHLTALAAERPEQVEVRYNLGYAQMRAGDLRGAIEHFRKATMLQPSFIRAYIMLGNALTQLADQTSDDVLLAEAEAAYRTATSPLCREADDALRASAHFNLANAVYRRRDYANAIPLYRTAIELAPDHAGAHANLGLCQVYVRDFAAAVETLIVAVRLDSANHQAWYNLGTAYEQLENLDAAVDAYRTSADLSPQNVMLRLRLAETARQAGRLEDAIRALEEALELKPELDASRKELDRLRRELHGG